MWKIKISKYVTIRQWSKPITYYPHCYPVNGAIVWTPQLYRYRGYTAWVPTDSIIDKKGKLQFNYYFGLFN